MDINGKCGKHFVWRGGGIISQIVNDDDRLHLSYIDGSWSVAISDSSWVISDVRIKLSKYCNNVVDGSISLADCHGVSRSVEITQAFDEIIYCSDWEDYRQNMTIDDYGSDEDHISML